MSVLFFVILMTTAALVHADVESLATSQSLIEQADRSGQLAQQRVDRLDDQAQTALNEYRQIKAETDQLALYNRQMTAIVDDQENELQSLARQISEIERTERGILPLMSRMLDTLEAFIELDVPFLPQERSARVALLRDMMVRGDVAIAEKFRRVLEAYQIEVDYGRNIEAYRGQIDRVSFDFLRIGRVALYRIANDGGQAWLWSSHTQTWQLLEGGYLRDLRKALKVAQQVAAPELLVLPMHTQGAMP